MNRRKKGKKYKKMNHIPFRMVGEQSVSVEERREWCIAPASNEPFNIMYPGYLNLVVPTRFLLGQYLEEEGRRQKEEEEREEE